MDLNYKNIPKEAIQALKIIEELLGSTLIAVYLYGSAVMGGLRKNSDIDILAVTNHDLSKVTRKHLTNSLMQVSGRIGNEHGLRSLEVTVVNKNEILPWRFPPKYEFMYGEWLREEFEMGKLPEPTYDPDFAILLAQAMGNSVNLFGLNIADILEPVPMTDIRRAIKESLPGLIANTKGDERNVILTLARMLLTVSTGEIGSKDMAAEWAIPILTDEHAAILGLARKAYLGEYEDKWEGLESEVASLVHFMKRAIEAKLDELI